MWSAAAAVTCATVGLSGAIAANATTTKTAPAMQAASPTGEKPKAKLPYPRLDATNVVTGFTATVRQPPPPALNPVGELLPTTSNHYTGSARRGNPWVFDANNNRWVNFSGLFSGFIYDIALAPAPSTPLLVNATPALLPITLPATGGPAGVLRVTVRQADGAIRFTDCRVSQPTVPATAVTFTEIPLSVANCSNPSTLPSS